MSPSPPLKIALDLREVSVSAWGNRRFLGLVRELDQMDDSVSLELIVDPTPDVARYPWSPGNRVVSPRRRTWGIHHPRLGYLRQLTWGRSRVMHFLTGDIWRVPTCKTVVSLRAPAPLRFADICFTGKEEETSYLDHLRMVFRVADQVVTDSESAKEEILGLHPHGQDRVRVIKPGIDPVFFPEEWGVEDRSRFCWNLGLKRGFLLHTGGVDVLSGLDFLLDTYRIYREQNSTPRKLVITGGPHHPRRGMPTLHELVIQQGLFGEVILVGHVSDFFLRRLYCSAALLVHPAMGGSQGYAPLEAMACGCPVLCSDAGVLPERVGQGAKVIPIQDPAEWAGRLVDLLENRDLRVDLVEKGLARAKEFKWEYTAREMIQVYQQAAQNV